MTRAEAKKWRQLILNGTVLAVDPSSGSYTKTNGQSYPGYALFKAGKLVDSGIIEMDGKDTDIWERLRELYDCLHKEFPKPDVLVVEQIRGGFAHQYLKWSVAVIATAVRAPVVIEMNVKIWKSYVDTSYLKTDEQDAIWIGKALLRIASE